MAENLLVQFIMIYPTETDNLYVSDIYITHMYNKGSNDLSDIYNMLDSMNGTYTNPMFTLFGNDYYDKIQNEFLSRSDCSEDFMYETIIKHWDTKYPDKPCPYSKDVIVEFITMSFELYYLKGQKFTYDITHRFIRQ